MKNKTAVKVGIQNEFCKFLTYIRAASREA